MTLADVEGTLQAHRALIDRVVLIISDFPWRSDDLYDGEDDVALKLVLVADEAVVSWRHCGYYESSWSVEAKFPASLLLKSAEEIQALREEAKREEAARVERVRLASLAAARERKEAHDLAEYARLLAKFGVPK